MEKETIIKWNFAKILSSYHLSNVKLFSVKMVHVYIELDSV